MSNLLCSLFAGMSLLELLQLEAAASSSLEEEAGHIGLEQHAINAGMEVLLSC